MGFLDGVKNFFGNIGKKIQEGTNWLGSKISDGFNKVKEIPVLGKIVDVVTTPYQYAIKGAGALANGVGSLLQGDVKGAVNTGLNYAKDYINQPGLLEKATSGTPLEGIGKLATNIASNVVRVGGTSFSDLKDRANTAMDVAGSLIN